MMVLRLRYLRLLRAWMSRLRLSPSTRTPRTLLMMVIGLFAFVSVIVCYALRVMFITVVAVDVDMFPE
jgi:hypothetical protein